MKYLIIVLLFSFKQLYLLIKSNKELEVSIWLFSLIFAISNTVRSIQILLGFMFLPLVTFWVICKLAIKSKFEFSSLLNMPNRHDIRLMTILEILIKFVLLELGLRMYFILKKCFVGGRINPNPKEFIFFLIVGSPLWFLQLIEDISIEIQNIFREDLSNKAYSYRFLIRVWLIKKAILDLLYDRLSKRYKILISLRIYVRNGGLDFNPNLKFHVREFNLKESSILSKTAKGVLKGHPMLNDRALSEMGYPVTHLPPKTLRGTWFKFSHDRRLNFIATNTIQDRNIISQKKIGSFEADSKEKMLGLKCAEYHRWTSDNEIVLNKFDKVVPINASFKYSSREELIKNGVNDKVACKLISERNEYKDLTQHELDYMEGFFMSNSIVNESGRRALDVESLSRYGFKENGDIVSIAVSLNKQKEIWKLVELEDSYIEEFSKNVEDGVDNEFDSD